MNNQLPQCPICGNNLRITIAHGRKSGKPFIMLMCARDGRHFRAFISDQNYVQGTLVNIEAVRQSKEDNQK